MRHLYNFVKTVWIVFWWMAGSLVLWLPVGLAGAFGRNGKLAFRFCQAWVWAANRVTFVKVTTRRQSTQPLDPNRNYVIMANHQSYLDIPALMLKVGIPFRWVIKKEFAYLPLFGWGLYLARHIFIDRSQPKKAIRSMDDAAKKMPKGVGIAVFPEGTRANDGVVKGFKVGGFLMAVRSEMPILPVTINGSWRIMPNKKSLVFHPGPIELVIGEPIETKGYAKKDVSFLIKKTREQILSNLDPDFPIERNEDATSGVEEGHHRPASAQ